MCRVFVYGQVLNLADVTRCVFYPGVPVDVSRFLMEIGLIQPIYRDLYFHVRSDKYRCVFHDVVRQRIASFLV